MITLGKKILNLFSRPTDFYPIVCLRIIYTNYYIINLYLYQSYPQLYTVAKGGG